MIRSWWEVLHITSFYELTEGHFVYWIINLNWSVFNVDSIFRMCLCYLVYDMYMILYDKVSKQHTYLNVSCYYLFGRCFYTRWLTRIYDMIIITHIIYNIIDMMPTMHQRRNKNNAKMEILTQIKQQLNRGNQ